ncbi:MAG TPA: hypothetical protein VFL12_08800 [Thermoanaerobaculia bacterium]|nr:hypothetical protein [Thermoanaerobaculia bacterium]
MGTVRIEAEKVFARPISVVEAQFVDMQHHSTARVHGDLDISNVRPQQDGCLCTARRRVMGKLQEDEIEVRRNADGSSTLRSVGGTNAGLLITQRFESLGTERTRVHLTFELPVHGVMALLSPLVRAKLRKDTARALEEDRRDLEERGYPATAR